MIVSPDRGRSGRGGKLVSLNSSAVAPLGKINPSSAYSSVIGSVAPVPEIRAG